MQLPDYLSTIETINDSASSQSWLTGSTLLASDLSVPYSGDIDLLIDCSKERLEVSLVAQGINYEVTYFGALRISLRDGNSADLYASEAFRDESAIHEHLEKYDFSCVSQALNISTNRRISTPKCREAIRNREFRLNTDYSFVPEDTVSLIKRYWVFQRFFGLRSSDERTRKFIINLEESVNSTDALIGGRRTVEYVSKSVSEMFDSELNVTPSRGIVRNSLIGGVSVWDDYDVLISVDTESCQNLLCERSIPFTVNYFGMPKARNFVGQKVDFICSPEKMQESRLKRFVHNIDRVAWHPHDRKFFCPSEEISQLQRGELELDLAGIDRMIERSRNFYLLKTAYYIALYGFTVSAEVMNALKSRIYIDRFCQSCAVRMTMELLCRAPQDRLSNFSSKYHDLQKGCALEIVSSLLCNRMNVVC